MPARRYSNVFQSLLVALIATIAMISLAPRSKAQPGPPPVAAVIIGLDRQSSSYYIRRGNMGIQVRFYAPLINGDIIQVLDPSASLTIRFVNAHIVRVTRANSPFRINLVVQRPSAGSNMGNVVWMNVTRSGDAGVRTMGSRGVDTLSAGQLRMGLPGLADGVAVIAAGERKFAVEWNGGKPPYRVVLTNGAGRVLSDEAAIKTQRLLVTSRLVAFEPGKYSLTLTDAEGARVQGSFEASSQPLPAPGVEQASDLEGDALAAFTAAWLIEKDQKRLSYEAYLRIQDAAENGWQPAIELRRWLGSGAPSQ